MKVYEFGTGHEKNFVMFQCAAEPWWVFKDSAEAMSRDYHVFLVIADGHDEMGTTFVSIEKNVDDAAAYLREKGVCVIDGLYGVSMGGASVIRFLATQDIPVRNAIIDAGITPYPYPGFICRLIAVKDWIMMMLGTKSYRFMKLAAPPELWRRKEKMRKIITAGSSSLRSTTFPQRRSITYSGPQTTIPCRIRYGWWIQRSNTGTGKKKRKRAGTTWLIHVRHIPRQSRRSIRDLPMLSWS